MADNTTELEVLDQIVDVLGGQSGQYETVVPTLQQILALLGGGGGGGGYNPALSVGRADALTGADETAQWAQRESTGSGAATVRNVQGAAVRWNQHVKDESTEWRTLNGTISYADGVITITPNGGDGFSYCQAYQNMDISGIGGHKYFVSMDFLKEDWSDTEQASNYAFPTLFGVWLSFTASFVPSKSVTTWQHLSGIVSQESDNPSTSFTFRSYGDTYPFSLKNVMVIDLTQMFGSGNEPTTVAEFEAMYPEAYYPYSAPTLKPVQIAGIASADAQGGELDSVEWTAFTLRGAGTIGDMLYSDHVKTRVGVVDLGTLTWFRNEITAGSGVYAFENDALTEPFPAATTNLKTALYPCVGNSRMALLNTDKAMTPWNNTTTANIGIRDDAYSTAADFKAAMNGVLMFYELATPTTTPISPALPMSYKVQQGGSESIIVPEGEVSAAPVLTIAEGESAAELVMGALACIAAPDGPTATANHAINTYLTMGGKLYKVTRAIAVGETIAAGTNVTQTTVMAELIARTA